MRGLQHALRIRRGEEATALRLIGLMLVVWSGSAVGGNGVESLFFARFGPENLPFMYMALGVITLPTTLAVTALLARSDPRRVLVGLPVALSVLVLGLRLLLEAPGTWVYPMLWLGMMVVWILVGVGSWGLAGAVHDTRQAKRLFPLYGAGVILGSSLGGLATAPLAAWLNAENLLLVWAAALLGAWAVARSVVGSGRRHRHPWFRGRRPRRAGSASQLADGFRYVRRSPLLGWMSAAMVLFAILYFSLSLPFARAATARFPDADRLAGFLGLLMGVGNGVALIVSLFAANRLFSRFGAATVVATFPVLYLVGFSVLAVGATFVALAIFRLLQLVWMYGLWTTGWQALFNVVPPERRAQARTFMDGVAMQVGVVLAGALLLVGDRMLPAPGVFVIAAAAAAVAVVLTWGVRRVYGGAVLDALRVGWPEVFVPEEQPFSGMAWDRAALSALGEGAQDPDRVVRRISMEIAAELPVPESRALAAEGLGDDDPEVRAAALRVLTEHCDPSVLPRVLRLLADPHPLVRATAAAAAVPCSRRPADAAPALRPLLNDPDPHVRIEAAAALRRAASDVRALELLLGMAASAPPGIRAAAVRVLGRLGEGFEAVAAALSHDDSAVRRAAVEALGRFESERSLVPLAEALGDEEPALRESAAAALTRFGDEARSPLEEALHDDRRAEGALLALGHLPVGDAELIRAYAGRQRSEALRYHALWAVIAGDGDRRVALLEDAVRRRALEHGRRAVLAMMPLGDGGSIRLAVESLDSRDAGQRANALETLETAAPVELVRPLLPIWEPESRRGADGLPAVAALLRDDDAWIRGCAALAAGSFEEPSMRADLERLAEGDPDAIVREAAARALEGDAVETLSTLSVMERVMALRVVPLFRELSPRDLKRVAEAAAEAVYPHASVIAEHGEPGDAMHVVVSGEVRVLLDQEPEPLEVARRGPGYIVGEMAVLTDEPRMASLIAEGEVRTLSLDRRRFQRILRERPDTALAVMRELCHRLREVHERDAAPA